MRLLSIEERHNQAQTFIDLWIKEFMAEMDHAESVFRGNVSARKNESLLTPFLNISFGLLSLVPIPGLALACIAIPALLERVSSHSGIWETIQKEAVRFFTKQTANIVHEELKDMSIEFSTALSSSALVDRKIMQTLAHWLGTELVKRYEQLLMERLSTDPKELEVLARGAARRSIAFLAEHPLPRGSLDIRMAHLLSGVALGVSPRIPKFFFTKTMLKSRDEALFLNLSVEDALQKGAWFSGDTLYEDDDTEWLKSTMPKYGYVAGKLNTHTKVCASPSNFSDWLARRLYQPITVECLEAYLNSFSVLDAKTQNITATQTLAEFAGFPSKTVVLLSGDLRGLCLAHGNFEGVDWSGSQFSGDLSYASFQRAILYGCTFDQVTSTQKSSVDFSNSRLSFSCFQGAKLSGIVHFTQVDLTGVDLSGAFFGRVNDVGASFYKANLTDFNDQGLLQKQAKELIEMRQSIDELQQQVRELEKQKCFRLPSDDNLLDRALDQLVRNHQQALARKLPYLEHYISSDVIEYLPESQSLVEYMQKSGESNMSGAAESLASAMDEYLNGSGLLFLLLGDPGAGKSLWAWQHSHRQFQASQTMVSWIPLVIELKAYTLSEVKDLLPRYLKEVCGLTEQAIQALQASQDSKYRLLVIFDGFDELKQEASGSRDQLFQDFFNTCGAGQWQRGQIKVMVTCRTRYLENRLMEERYFHLRENHFFYRRILLPFTLEQVYAYLTSSVDSLIYNFAVEQIAGSESLNGMVRNPFILSLFAKALPDFHKMNIKNIKRYDIYLTFVQQWFLREVERFGHFLRESLGIFEPRDAIRVMEDFLFYAGMLAIQMYQYDALVISFHDHGSVWKKFVDIIAMQALEENTIKASLEKEYLNLSFLELLDLKHQGIHSPSDYAQEKLGEALKKSENTLLNSINGFLISSPLQKICSNKVSFIHKSLYEFFFAYGIIQLAGQDKPLDERVIQTREGLKAQPGHEARRIQHEPQILRFLEDQWVGQSNFVVNRIKETLFAVIEDSKDSKNHPEHGASAANAITILNWMQVPLISQSWQGIQIPGADLSYAILAHTDLSGANLVGSCLYRAYLKETNFSHANLTNVNFGERPPIKLSESVVSIAYHPREPWIAIAWGNQIVQYNSETGEQVGVPMQGHNNRISSVTYSPDGGCLASGSWDGTVRQWESATGRCLEYVMRAGLVTCIAYFGDGKYLASVGADAILLWDANTGESLSVKMEGDAVKFISVACSPDGRYLAAGGFCGAVWQWEAKTGRLVWRATIGVGTNVVSSLAYSPDGKCLAGGSWDGTIAQWSTDTGALFGPVMQGHTDKINSIAYSRCGKYLASGSDDKTLRQWDAATGVSLGQVMRGHTDVVWSVAYSPDGRYLASGGDDQTLRQWDVIIDASFSQVMQGHVASVDSVAYSSDGQKLASQDCYGVVQQWTMSNDNGWVMNVHASSDWVARRFKDMKVYAEIHRSTQPSAPCPKEFAFRCMVLSPNERIIATGGDDKIVRQWELSTKAYFGQEMKGHTGSVLSLAYSPNEKHLVSGGADNRVIMWCVLTAQVLWCTRSAPMPLFTVGLILTGSIGLRDDQIKLLEDAGYGEYQETDNGVQSRLGKGNTVFSIASPPGKYAREVPRLKY